MINDLFANETTPTLSSTTDFGRIRRDAIWWSNLHANQGPINVYQGADGRFFLSRSTITPPVPPATGPTLVMTVRPNMVYQSGERNEWREWQMHLGDRRY